jgi:hypothetical protein
MTGTASPVHSCRHRAGTEEISSFLSGDWLRSLALGYHREDLAGDHPKG